MAAPNKIYHSEQEIANQGFDADYNVPVGLGLGEDGSGRLQRPVADSMATKVTVDGSVTYVAVAAPGTAQSTAKWQAMKIDKTSGVVITWADSANFSQVATDLTSLTFT